MVLCQSIIHAKVMLRQSVQITFICQSGFTPKLILRQTVHVKVFHVKVFDAKVSVSPLFNMLKSELLPLNVLRMECTI